jgi:periplasmic divalent cation tolerance protein
LSAGTTGISVVLVTAPDMEVAERLAGALVEDGLATCVSLVPSVTSIYRWESAVQRASEVLMIVKGTVDGFENLRRRVVELHPYDVPEVIELDVRDGSPDYLEWVKNGVREKS